MDELADKVKMDPVEFRIKNLPPEAPNAMWARRTCARAPRRSAGTSGIRPAIRRPARSRPAWACAVNTWGGGGRGPAARTARSRPTAASSMRVRHAGHRHRHAHARRDGRGRDARPAGRRRSSRRSATRLYPFSGGVGGSTTAARHQPGDPRRRRSRRSTRCSAKVAPALGVEPATLVAAGGRIHVKDNPSKGLSWTDACKLLGTAADLGRRRLGSRACRSRTSGVQFAEVDGRHRDRHRQGHAHPRVQDCGLVVEPADRREPGLRRRHRVAQLRAVRGSHPRSQHRARW